MNRLTDKERNAFRDDIRSFDEQVPYVGVFQYDPVGHCICGMRKMEVTPVMEEGAAEKGKPSIDYPQVETMLGAEGDYGGRVVWSIDKFMLLVGNWAELIQVEAWELLEKDFSLQYFEFECDEHWNLCHGETGCMPSYLFQDGVRGIVDWESWRTDKEGQCSL